MAWYDAPQVDWSALSDIPKMWREGKKWREERDTNASASQAISRAYRNGVFDPQAAFEELGKLGNVNAMTKLAPVLKAMQPERMTPYQSESLAIQRARVEQQAKKAASPRRSAADTRALYSAEDEVPQIQGTIDALNRAKEINDKTFSGVGASTRGYLGSKLPDWAVPDLIADPETAKTTNEWELIMSPAALEQMSNTLKGATTDFELRKYIGLLADPSTPAETRKGIIERMLTLANQQKKVKEGRIKELRDTGQEPDEDGEVGEGDLVEGPDGTQYIVRGGELVPAE